ncbi:hypothetical protein B0H19DRAFT_1237222 [Mycena capillaripes]|nr:hypothetical protein B0H19DRAFT_1237222 [Mycena capillaripes]
MSFIRTLVPPCVTEEDPWDDESNGGGEDRSMMGDVDDRGEDERQRGGWALAGTQHCRRGGLALPGCSEERVAARVGGRPFPAVLSDELVHAGAFLDASERRGSRKYHKGRAALRTTGLRMAYVRTGWGKNAAGTAEAWEEVAGKEQASPTSGRSVRARETAVSEVIWRKEGRGPSAGALTGRRRVCWDSMSTYRWWAGTSGDVTLCDISGLDIFEWDGTLIPNSAFEAVRATGLDAGPAPERDLLRVSTEMTSHLKRGNRSGATKN